MIPGSAIDALFAMLTEAGYGLGDKRLRFDGDEITLRLKREGDVIYVTATPAIKAAKAAGWWSHFAPRRITETLTEGVIGRVKIERSAVTAFVQTDIIGTVEERIEVSR